MKNKIKIYFLENSFDYNGNDLDSSLIAGSEKTLINISNELAKDKKFLVKVFNNTSNPSFINNVYWQNINQINQEDIGDYVIAMSDSNLFDKMSCKKNYLWSHSIQSIEKFIRKKQLLPFFKHKPIMILEGEYHFDKRSLFTSFFGKEILMLAPDYDFINTNVDINYIPPPNAIFTTKSDRNLDILINSWYKIKNKVANSKLFINPPYNLNQDEIKNDIFLRKKESKNLLIRDLISSRLFITPGHKTEVFCLAAEEARELCIPIVTLGYGSLYERVDHGLTGFIARNRNEFISYAIDILVDDNLFLTLKKNLLNKRNSRNFSQVKEDLIKLLKI